MPEKKHSEMNELQIYFFIYFFLSMFFSSCLIMVKKTNSNVFRSLY